MWELLRNPFTQPHVSRPSRWFPYLLEPSLTAVVVVALASPAGLTPGFCAMASLASLRLPQAVLMAYRIVATLRSSALQQAVRRRSAQAMASRQAAPLE